MPAAIRKPACRCGAPVAVFGDECLPCIAKIKAAALSAARRVLYRKAA